ncbi:tenascin-N-like [Alosa pseudoharengus]|uniref:tenascin-N-like n=1 Tax=Alosa pseudoharengus TaxID=34774 RepID=UPI003F88CD2B
MVVTLGKDDQQSKCVLATTYTDIPALEELKTERDPDGKSALVTWRKPDGLDQVEYVLSLCKEGKEREKEECLRTITTTSEKCLLPDLERNIKYTVRVSLKLKNGHQGKATICRILQVVPAPEQLTLASVTPTSIHLTWSPPHGMEQTPHSYQISYHSGGTESETLSTDSCSAVIKGLKPCTDYIVSISVKLKDGKTSEALGKILQTGVPVPRQLKVASVAPASVHLTWSPPHGMDHTPHSYQVSYHSGGTEPQTISTDSCSTVIRGLQPDTTYSINVCTVIKDGRMSEPEGKKIHTEIAPITFYTIVIGNTQNHHKVLKGMLINKGFTEVHNVKNCDVILAFCVIVSRVGTDMEAALKEIPDFKPAVLVVMHHTFDSNHVTPDTSRFVRGRNIMVVDILFHEDKGILRCPRNTQAENKMLEMVCACSEPGRHTSSCSSPIPKTQLPPATPHTKTDALNNSIPSQHGNSSGKSRSKESTKKPIDPLQVTSRFVRATAK